MSELSRLETLQLALGERIGRRRASWLLHDARNVVALGRWVARRGPRKGSSCYPYDGQFRVILAMAAFLTVLEGGIVDGFLLAQVHGWIAWTVLILHLYVLYLVLASRASWRVNPHAVCGDTLLLRQGNAIRVAVQLRDIERVTAARRDAGHAVRWHALDDDAFELPVSKETNTTLCLRPGVSVLTLYNGALPANVIHFYSDDPKPVAAQLSKLLREAT